MNPLAQHLNDRLGDDRPEILSMLSTLGQSMFYPKRYSVSVCRS